MGQSIDQRMNGSWNAYLASPADFVGADDIITNLAKESLGSNSSNALPNFWLLLVLWLKAHGKIFCKKLRCNDFVIRNIDVRSSKWTDISQSINNAQLFPLRKFPFRLKLFVWDHIQVHVQPRSSGRFLIFIWKQWCSVTVPVNRVAQRDVKINFCLE